MLAAALRFAGGGISIFPVNERKAPLTEHGFHDASTEREQIERWWSKWPDAGIATPDFDVVDADHYKPECGATWERIKPLVAPGTPQTRTPRGGDQYFYAPGTLTRGKLGPGIDNRYAGSNYVLLPPSLFVWEADGVRHEGRYEAVVDVLTRRPKPAPDFPVDTNGGGTAAEIAKKIKTGERITDDRNQSTFWRAVQLLEQGTPADQLEHIVREWVNANCAGNLAEINVAKQCRGAARFLASKRSSGTSTSMEPTPGLTLVPLSEIEARPIVYLDKPLLQKTGFHLLVGRKGVGKGTNLADLASRITRGELGEKANVIWISSEDSAAIDIKPRVLAAEGDPERIYIVQDWVQLPRDLDRIREAITETGDVGLVTIDPVGNHIAGKNSNAETEIRDAIAPLNHLSDELETLLVGVRHLSEKECSRGVLAAILGSSAWVQVPRAVLAIVRDNDDPSVSHIQCVAGNRLPPGTPGRMFRVEGVLVPGLENEVTRAVPLGDSTQDVEAMLSASSDKGPSKSDRAREVLLDTLREAGGEMESDQLDATVAEATGLKAKTVQNLRGELKDKGWLRPVPEKDETGAVLRWIVKLTNAAPAASPDPLARANTNSRDLDYLSQSSDPDPDIPSTRESRDLAPEPIFSSYLVDERGRCVRHPDEPEPWCLECKAQTEEYRL